MRRTVTIPRIVAVLALLLVLPASPANAARDAVRPRVTITTPDGATRVGAPYTSPQTTVAGTATDNRSGVRKVTVVFCPNGQTDDRGGWTCGTGVGGTGKISSVRADLSCRDHERHACNWVAQVPQEPSNYLVFAEAVDRAGNVRYSWSITIVVI